MTDVLLNILPVFLLFFVGLILYQTGIIRREHADIFLKLVFYVALPGMIMNSIPQINLTAKLGLLPVISAIVIFSMYFISLFIGKIMGLKPATLGVFMIGTMILNNGLLFPFIIEMYGNEGLARLVIFDFSNGLLAFTFVYYQACKYGTKTKNDKTLYKKFLFSPTIWALVAGIILNLTNANIPPLLTKFFQITGDLTIPLIMLALGVYFTPRIVKAIPLFTAILIRSGIGFAIGLILCYLFNIEGLSKTIVLISSAAPIGFNSLTFATLEEMDKEFAASLVSVAMVIGLILAPILIMIL